MAQLPRKSAIERAGQPASQLVNDVLSGLARRPKELSPIYFYDERGSQLFERICDLPEYYLTRAESEILLEQAAAMARCVGPEALVVEFGSGSSAKTRLLLDELVTPAGYVPVDISRSHLLAAAARIAAAYPGLEVMPVCADFTRPFELPVPRRTPRRAVAFFPGSTIGNFARPQAVELLRVIRRTMGARAGLLIGVDLLKDPRELERAYNDSAGVTASFNRNMLLHLNREVGSDFDPAAFDHAAVWEANQERIEMRLVSRSRQSVHVAGHTVELAEGEAIVTEHCHKYSVAGFAALAHSAGWIQRRCWIDAHRRFSVQYLEA
jgi:dimethylhistidine N-methyltransferase